MPRKDLNVPYAEKDEAKKLGAKWDAVVKTWYVPENLDPAPFSRWFIPEEAPPSGPNIKAQSYYIAENSHPCWKCSRQSKVYAIIVPEGFDEFYTGNYPEEDRWARQETPCVLSNIEVLSENVLERIQKEFPKFRFDFSKTLSLSYLMNHCEHCDAKIGDFNLIQEVDTPFSPTKMADKPKCILKRYQEPLTATASYVWTSVTPRQFFARI